MLCYKIFLLNHTLTAICIYYMPSLSFFDAYIAENFGSLKQQFTVFKLHHQNFFQRQNFLILEETERSSYLFLFCALQPSRYLPQEIKVIILTSISNSEFSDTGLFWLRMWVFLKWSMVITDVTFPFFRAESHDLIVCRNL